MKRLLIIPLASSLICFMASGCSSSSKDKERNDSIAAAELEAARLDSIRQDSINRRNFTTPDLAFNELHGHVKKCEWGHESDGYYAPNFIYNDEGVLSPKQGGNNYTYRRNKQGQITKVSGEYETIVYGWSENRISSKEVVESEGETAFGGGAVHYHYDENGLLHYTTTDDGCGENGYMRNMKTVYSDYQFDEMGNWISRKSITTYQVDECGNGSWENRSETNKEVRVITYHDSDIGKGNENKMAELHAKWSADIEKSVQKEQEYSSYSEEPKSSYTQTSSFRTPSDVISYTSNHSFYNGGDRLKIDFDAVYLNGTALTGAPRVTDIYGTTATVVANSPYSGGGALHFYVNASNGTITQNGDVFRMR